MEDEKKSARVGPPRNPIQKIASQNSTKNWTRELSTEILEILRFRSRPVKIFTNKKFSHLDDARWYDIAYLDLLTYACGYYIHIAVVFVNYTDFLIFIISMVKERTMCASAHAHARVNRIQFIPAYNYTCDLYYLLFSSSSSSSFDISNKRANRVTHIIALLPILFTLYSDIQTAAEKTRWKNRPFFSPRPYQTP